MRLLLSYRHYMDTHNHSRSTYNKKTSDGVSTLLNTLLLIPRHRTISTQELHQKLLEIGIVRNQRSIKRYLDDIIIDLFNVEKDESSIPHTYRKLTDNLLKQGAKEALVLCLIKKYLKPVIPAHIFKAYQSRFEDAALLLRQSNEHNKEATWLDKVHIEDFVNPNLINTIKPAITQDISAALFNNRLLNIQYSQAQMNADMSEPLGVVLNENSINLVCRHQHSLIINTLPILLIESVAVSTFSFEYPTDFTLQDYVTRTSTTLLTP